MKKMIKLSSVVGFTLALATTTVCAQQPPPNFAFDENGHGLSIFNGVTNSLGYDIAPDPTGGVTGNVLIYHLPMVVASGDLALIEATTPPSGSSDILRFFTPAGANFSSVIFYSDVEANETSRDLADSGLPVAPNAIPINEIGIEGGLNGAFWTPLPGQPGAGPAGTVIEYGIISDVPEPSSVALLGFGAAALLVFRRR